MTAEARRIAYLEARIRYLEHVLTERSRMLRTFARDACDEDLINASRAAMGLPPMPRAGFGLRGWKETTTLTSVDVESTMRELWRSITPPRFVDEE